MLMFTEKHFAFGRKKIVIFQCVVKELVYGIWSNSCLGKERLTEEVDVHFLN